MHTDDSDSRFASVTEEDIECWSYDKTDVALTNVRHLYNVTCQVHCNTVLYHTIRLTATLLDPTLSQNVQGK